MRQIDSYSWTGRLPVFSLICVFLLALQPVVVHADEGPALRQRMEAAAQKSGSEASGTMADGDWFEREIGEGVFWRHYQFENLYGGRQSVSVLDADLKTSGVAVTLPYLAKTRGLTSTFVPEQEPNAIAAINGTYFDTSVGGGGANTYLRINNQVVTSLGTYFGPMGTEGAITFSDDGVIRIEARPEGDWDNLTDRRDVMANGPMLLVSGEYADFDPFGAHCTNRHPRTAVGMTADDRLIMVTVDGRTDQAMGMTCEELARLMQELGCVDALNLDGGGSTTMWVAGERANGVVNYPSDNGEYDHEGERPCANAIAVSAPPGPKKPWDARLLDVEYSAAMTAGTTQTVTLEYENLGTETWTADNTHLVLTRPRTRLSDFYTTGAWTTQSRPALLSPATVASGDRGRFSFTLTAPELEAGRPYSETFGLTQTGVGHFGPADNEPRLKILAYPPEVPSTGTVIIETRMGGQNRSRYSDMGGWADAPGSSTAEGLTPGLGQRYSSTFRTKAGTKTATFRPNFAKPGKYRVYVTFGEGHKTHPGVTAKVTYASGMAHYHIDQTRDANVWVELGTHDFDAGQDGYLLVSNEELNVSGNMYLAAAKFELVEDEDGEER